MLYTGHFTLHAFSALVRFGSDNSNESLPRRANSQFTRGVAKSRNAECRNTKIRNTKTRNHQNKAPDRQRLVHMYDESRSTVAHNCHGKSNSVWSLFIFIRNFTVCRRISGLAVVKVHFDRNQKKRVSTIVIRNLEMKSPRLFCLAEVSLLCFDRSVVLNFSQKGIGYTTLSSLRFYTLDQCFPCRIASLTF